MRDHRRLRGKARSVKRKTELRLKKPSWPSCARRATHSELSAVYGPQNTFLRLFFLLPRCRGTNTLLASDSVDSKKSNPKMFVGTFLCKLCTDGRRHTASALRAWSPAASSLTVWI